MELSERVELRKLARENFEFLFVDTNLLTPEELAVYCECLREIALEKSPFPEVKDKPAILPSAEFAMSDEETKCFEKVECPFKKHLGASVGSIMATDRQYIEWIAENCDGGFARDCQRYLANPTIARELD